MKKFLLASVALISLVSAASAADLAARRYTKAPAQVSPVYNWSGFYAGVMGGYGWGSGVTGGFGGGTLGYNWQAPGSQFVFGLEVDAAGADLSATATQTANVFGIPVSATAQQKIDAFGSVTGRAGVALDASLLYVKGGYAWADNKITTSGSMFGIPVFSGSDSHLHSGYTVGAGVEYMFAPSWSAKFEYMYANLSSQTYTIAGTSFDSGTIEVNTVKAGINYHFK
jgi:outer membrane immunogenic protein